MSLLTATSILQYMLKLSRAVLPVPSRSTAYFLNKTTQASSLYQYNVTAKHKNTICTSGHQSFGECWMLFPVPVNSVKVLKVLWHGKTSAMLTCCLHSATLPA